MIERLFNWLSYRFTTFVILDSDKKPYLTRIRLWQWGKDGPALYFHCIHRSDEDRELHDHPWSFASILLKGSYREFSEKGVRLVSWLNVKIDPCEAHRLELFRSASGVEKPVFTLVFRGKSKRVWGFWCDSSIVGGPENRKVWLPFYKFLDLKFGKGQWSEEYE